MKGFFYGLTAGLAAGITAQMMIAKNHEQMLELVKNIKNSKFSLDDTLEELKSQKDHLEALIKEKENHVQDIEEDSIEKGEIV